MHFLFDHTRYEDFFFSVWSHNPEFHRHHSDHHHSSIEPLSTPDPPSVHYVMLGWLTLHPFCSDSPGPCIPFPHHPSKAPVWLSAPGVEVIIPSLRNPPTFDRGPILLPCVLALSPVQPRALSPTPALPLLSHSPFSPCCRHSPERLCLGRLSPERLCLGRLSPERLCLGRLSPERLCLGRLSPERLCLGRLSPERHCLGRHSPERLCLGRHSPERLCLGRHSPERLCLDRHSPERLCLGRLSPIFPFFKRLFKSMLTIHELKKED